MGIIIYDWDSNRLNVSKICHLMTIYCYINSDIDILLLYLPICRVIKVHTKLSLSESQSKYLLDSIGKDMILRYKHSETMRNLFIAKYRMVVGMGRRFVHIWVEILSFIELIDLNEIHF